ncbi:uncharacterized protein PSFLO_06114 [Pseudozyma flocculosa]|uniref:Ubiquitin-like protease family profile domain-containing protein n=1 Tax=Pseudozyma flocculosa TaxID=84751 RepID=A0A5C3F8D2_9BASI|nr:uncharacterized protein PSFLO_06114 [Pseudozyma flocculosa]
MDDTLTLSYRDAYLRRSDLATIEPDEWVGDNLLSFHSTWLHSTAAAPASIAMWPPAIVELLVSIDDPQEAKQVLPPIDQRWLCLPVSDRYGRVGSDASHWSLLLFDTATRRCIHFDSLPPANRAAADSVARAIVDIVARDHRSQGRVGGATTANTVVDQVETLPRQNNGSDCGVYVLALTHSLQPLLEANLANLHPDTSPNILDNVVDDLATRWIPERIRLNSK